MYCFVMFQKGLGRVFDESSQTGWFLQTILVIFQPIHTNPWQIIYLNLPDESLYLLVKTAWKSVQWFLNLSQTNKQTWWRTLFYNMYIYIHHTYIYTHHNPKQEKIHIICPQMVAGLHVCPISNPRVFICGVTKTVGLFCRISWWRGSFVLVGSIYKSAKKWGQMNVQAIELVTLLQKYIYMDFLLFWIKESTLKIGKSIFLIIQYISQLNSRNYLELYLTKHFIA